MTSQRSNVRPTPHLDEVTVSERSNVLRRQADVATAKWPLDNTFARLSSRPKITGFSRRLVRMGASPYLFGLDALSLVLVAGIALS